MRPEEVPIILAEDDEIDAEAIRRAFRRFGIANPLEWVENGEELMAILEGHDEERRALVILDLNMPRVSGNDFLAAPEPRRRKGLRVFVFTTSDAPKDRELAADPRVVDYLTKDRAGRNMRAFVSRVRRILELWPGRARVQG